MLCPNESDYFSQRMAEEVERAEQARDECAGAVHYELARRYEALAARCAAGVPEVLSAEDNNARITPQIIIDAVAAGGMRAA